MSKFKYLPVWVFKLIFFPQRRLSWALDPPEGRRTPQLIPAPANPKNREQFLGIFFPMISKLPRTLPPMEIFGLRLADFLAKPQLQPWGELHALVGISPPATSPCPSRLCSAQIPDSRGSGREFCVVFQLLPRSGLNLRGPRAGNSSPLNHTHELSSCKTSRLWNSSRKFWSLHHFLVIFNRGGGLLGMSSHRWTTPEKGISPQIPRSAFRGNFVFAALKALRNL